MVVNIDNRLLRIYTPINIDYMSRNNYIKNKMDNWKCFYIMKVIYNNIIYRRLKIKVRNVQQSLYMWKCKYILKKIESGDIK